MKIAGRIALVALAAGAVAACATSPTGRKQLMLVSEQQAISASRQAYVQEIGKARKEGKLVTDPRALNRVEVITERLVAQAVKMRPDSAGWEWSVEVIDDPENVNAWCMAGGLLSDSPGAAMATAAAAAKVAIDLPNSRTAETEADRIGIELAAKAGYDPRAAVTLWQKMGAVGGGKAPPAFLSTHPSDEQRQQRLGALAPQMMPYYQAPGARPSHPVRIGAGAA